MQVFVLNYMVTFYFLKAEMDHPVVLHSLVLGHGLGHAGLHHFQ